MAPGLPRHTSDSDADRLAATVRRLHDELDGLRHAQRHRAVIEQAKGLLAGRLGCTPDEAFTHLSQMSQQSNAVDTTFVAIAYRPKRERF